MARKLIVEIVGDSRSLERSFSRASGAARNFDKSLGRTVRGTVAGSGAFRGLGRSLAFASAGFLSTAAAASAVKSSIKAASDLTEELNKSSVVFRGSDKQVAAWSEHLTAAFGLTRAEALKTATTFGNMLVPMGFARRDAALMSERLVALAGDMASFNNASPQDTLAALQSGLAGMPRPLRQFGVFLSKDRIAAEALSAGIVKSNVDLGKVKDANEKVAITQAKLTKANKDYGAGTTQVAQATVTLHNAQRGLTAALGGTLPKLTQAQTTQAIYNIILRDTADAQGDATRTSGAFAGQLRVLHAQVGNLEERIGKALMPTVLRMIGAFNKWLSSSANQEKIIRGVNQAVRVLGDVIRAATSVVQSLIGPATAIKNLLGGWKGVIAAIVALKLASWARGVAGSFALVGARAGVATGNVRGLGGALGALPAVTSISLIIDTEILTHKKQIENLGNKLADNPLRHASDAVLRKLGLGGIQGGRKDVVVPLKPGGGAETGNLPRQAFWSSLLGMWVDPRSRTGGDARLQKAAWKAWNSDPSHLGVGGVIIQPNDGSVAQLDRAPILIPPAPPLKPAGAAARAVTRAVAAASTGGAPAVGGLAVGAAARVPKKPRRAGGGRASSTDAASFIVGEDARNRAARLAQIAARQAQITARQFAALGLEPGGQPLLQTTGKLTQRFGLLKGTPLDTPELNKEFKVVGQLLKGKFGKLGKDVRRWIQDFLDSIGQSGGGTSDQTKFRHASTANVLAGLNIDAATKRALRSRIAQLGPGGSIPQHAPVFAGGTGGAVYMGDIHLHGIQDLGRFEDELNKRRRRRPAKRRGT